MGPRLPVPWEVKCEINFSPAALADTEELKGLGRSLGTGSPPSG